MSKVKRKISLKDVSFDEETVAGEGFRNLTLQWIVDDKVGAKMGCFGYTEFLTDAEHGLHTHPNSEEIYHVISGHGIATSGDETFEIHPGDTVFVPKGEPHRFRNTSKTEPLKAFYAYFGAPNIKEAGHVVLGKKDKS